MPPHPSPYRSQLSCLFFSCYDLWAENSIFLTLAMKEDGPPESGKPVRDEAAAPGADVSEEVGVAAPGADVSAGVGSGGVLR